MCVSINLTIGELYSFLVSEINLILVESNKHRKLLLENGDISQERSKNLT